MPRTPKSRTFPVRQERSRATLQRLLDAAQDALETGGLAAATVPGIAERAGMSVGVVYKRFADKDALLRAVFERFFGEAARQNRAALDPIRWEGCGAKEILTAVVRGMVTTYRRHRGLLRALVLYVETHEDSAFRKSAEELMEAAFADVTALLLVPPRRKEIHHPDPTLGIEIALVMLGSSLRRLILAGHDFRAARAPGDAKIEAELTRAVLSYLAVGGRR